MAEYPEILQLSRHMNSCVAGKSFKNIHVVQRKCLNMDIQPFYDRLIGNSVIEVCNKGKWIHLILDQGYHLLISLGMGGDVLYFESLDKKQEKYQCLFQFEDGSGFTCKFWWFGHIVLVSESELINDKIFSKIACSPFDKEFTKDYFATAISTRKASVKNIIMSQTVVSGIGNAYIHDILFRAKIHPNTKAYLLSRSEIDNLYDQILYVMKQSIESKGMAYENDFYGNSGGFFAGQFIIGYREGHPCTECGTIVEKIKTGSTSSYICPNCQKEK